MRAAQRDHQRATRPRPKIRAAKIFSGVSSARVRVQPKALRAACTKSVARPVFIDEVITTAWQSRDRK